MNPYQGLKHCQKPGDSSVAACSNQHESLSGIETNKKKGKTDSDRKFQSTWIPIRDWNSFTTCPPLQAVSSNQHESLSGIETARRNIWDLTQAVPINMNPYQGLKQVFQLTTREELDRSNQHESLSGIETMATLSSGSIPPLSSNQHESLSGIETYYRLSQEKATSGSNQHESLSGIETHEVFEEFLGVFFKGSNQHESLSGIETEEFFGLGKIPIRSNQHESLSGIEGDRKSEHTSSECISKASAATSRLYRQLEQWRAACYTLMRSCQ